MYPSSRAAYLARRLNGIGRGGGRNAQGKALNVAAILFGDSKAGPLRRNAPTQNIKK